jgi:perosamine synthetase
MKIRVFKPFIKRKDMDSILTCIVSDAMGEGGERKRFLDLAKEYFLYDYAAAFRSPSVALGYALDALQLAEGSGVVISALSPAYYLTTLKERKLVPLYADVSPISGAIAKESAEERIAAGGRALVVHETFGILPDIASLKALGVPLIEDITQSIGAHNGDVLAGSAGDYVLLSMESEDIVTAGGGAVLFTRDKRNASILRKVLEEAPADCLISDMNAALAGTQLKGIPVSLARRREIAELYVRALSSTRHKAPVPEGDGEASYWSFPVLVATGLKDVVAYASKKEVDTRIAFETCSAAIAPIEACPCPNARSLIMRSLLFPLYPGIGRTQAEKVVKVLGTLP